MNEERAMNIKIGKKLLRPILKVNEWTIHDFLVECLADGHAFNPYWAKYRCPKASEFTDKAKADWEKSDQCLEDRIAVAILNGICTCYEDEEETGRIEDMTPHKLCEDDVYVGISIMAEKYDWHYDAFIDESFDGITCDVFLQCMALGDVIYG